MAIVHGGDGTVQCGVVAVQAGDAVGGRRMCSDEVKVKGVKFP